MIPAYILVVIVAVAVAIESGDAAFPGQQQLLQERIQVQDKLLVPNIVHLIVLDKRPLSRYTYLSILTIFHQINPLALYFHCIHNPHGEFWEALLRSSYASRMQVTKVKQPISLFSIPSPSNLAHKSDIVRMNILQTMGGIYLDTDVIVLRSFDPLRHASLSIGRQTIQNFCNGVIIAHNSSLFLRAWLEGFRTADFEKCWDCHSVVYPSRLAKNMTKDVNVIPIEGFYDPSFSKGDIHELFMENTGKPARMRPPYIGTTVWDMKPIPYTKYGQHLWHSVPVATRYLRAHSFLDICNSTSMYNEMLRYALRGSPFLKTHCPLLPPSLGTTALIPGTSV